MNNGNVNDEKDTKHSKDEDIDTGLACLIIMAQFHQIRIEKEQIKHTFAINDKISDIDMIRAARQIGLKSKMTKISSFDKLKQMVLPAIARLKDNRYIIIAQIQEDRLLIVDPRENAPKFLKKEEFFQLFSG